MKTPVKNQNSLKSLLKINKSTMLGLLSTNSMATLNNVLSILKARNHFELFFTIPLSLRIEFLIPNHSKSNSGMVKKILKMSNFQSGKYNLNLLDFALSNFSLQIKGSPQFKNPNQNTNTD